MPTFEFTSPEGKSYEISGPEGATREQAFSILQQQISAGTAQAVEPSAVVKAGRLLAEAPGYLARQAGLTARSALEGPAEAAQIVTEPVRQLLTNRLLPGRPLGEEATRLADTLGLPKPETPAERVAAGGSKLMAGGAGTSALLSATGRVVPLLQGLTGATNAMGVQLGSAAGAGAAGQAAKEADATPVQQLGATVLGGVGGGLFASAVPAAVGGIRNAVAQLRPQTDVQIDVQLGRLVPGYADLPERAKQAMRTETAQALRTGQDLDPAALSRLADFRAVGATPTRGMLTTDPVTITREQNLAKIQANSGSTGPGSLPYVQEGNNRAIIGRLNDLGGASEVDPRTTGQAIVSAVEGTRAQLRGQERELWNAARTHPGIQSPIEPNGLNAINARLGDEALMPYMRPEISRYMAEFQTGGQPFTPQHYANLRSMLSAELAKGGNEARAARAAVEALDAAPLVPIKAGAHIDFGNAPVPQAVANAMRQRDAQAGEAIELINRARGATRAAYAYEESNPIVQSIVAAGRSADPERIASSYLLNPKSTVADAERVRDVVGPGDLQTIKDGLATWIKKQAIQQAADETGNFKQFALNKTLNDDKLAVFFTPDEVAQFRRVGRVAALIQNQPAGSAVGNSNTAAVLIGRGMDAMQSVVPGLGMVAQPMRDAAANISVNIGANRAQQTAPALLNPDLQRQLGVPSLLGPAAALAGSSLLPPGP